MINKAFTLVVLVLIALTGFSKPVKVIFTYNSDDVSLIYNDKVYKENPETISIDFELGGQLIAYKSGFESQFIKISKDNIFMSFNVKLLPSQNKFDGGGIQVELKKVSFINYVTNYTQEEVTEIINSKFNQVNIATFSQNTVFKNTSTKSNRFSIGAEVLKSTSKNGSYSTPYYLFSYQKIKWYVVDNVTNKFVLEQTTEGVYLAYFKAKKGMVANDRLKEITVLSIEDATQKLLNSPEFRDLMAE
jgi:hypothetical protein